MTVFECAGLEAAIADDDAMRNSEQLGIGEFDAWPRIAIIVEHLDSGLAELIIERIGRGAHSGGLVEVERNEHDMKRCNGSGQMMPRSS